MPRKKKAPVELLNCSFCGKDQNSVKKLMTGPGVCICNECVHICVEIMMDDVIQDAETKSIIFKKETLSAIVAQLL